MMRAVFLDRDGIINEDTGYVHKIEDLKIVSGIIELCHIFSNLGYHIFIVTNQSGIARGLYDFNDFMLFQSEIEKIFTDNHLNIQETKFCPHHSDGTIKNLSFNCECRKPKPGMLLDLIKKYNIDTNASWMFGDKISDMMCAKAASVKNRVLISQSSAECNNLFSYRFPTVSVAKEYLNDVINSQ